MPKIDFVAIYQPLTFNLSGGKTAPWVNAVRVRVHHGTWPFGSTSFSLSGFEAFGRLQRGRTFNMQALRSAKGNAKVTTATVGATAKVD